MGARRGAALIVEAGASVERAAALDEDVAGSAGARGDALALAEAGASVERVAALDAHASLDTVAARATARAAWVPPSSALCVRCASTGVQIHAGCALLGSWRTRLAHTQPEGHRESEVFADRFLPPPPLLVDLGIMTSSSARGSSTKTVLSKPHARTS